MGDGARPAEPSMSDEYDAYSDGAANMANIDEYMEKLYDDIEQKRKGAAMILHLARNPDNLEELFQNETLIGALARTLREDWKRNKDLAINIVYTFFCFSSFSQFHPVIIHFKIGGLCMEIVEHEVNQYETWKAGLEKKRNAAEHDAASKKEYERAKRKFKDLSSKQEQLLRVAVYLLLNIAEDVKVRNQIYHVCLSSMVTVFSFCRLRKRCSTKKLCICLSNCSTGRIWNFRFWSSPSSRS